ncbi:MAG TPA: histidine phosphatase family protein, partial [Acidimicrobiales bacterium]|nr:histidine phosphatase family protein [Acidimicrobiales bacterium]
MTIPPGPSVAPTRLLVLRHGESTWNAEDRWQGWADPPLSATGEEQARLAGHRLRAMAAGFTRIVASDLRRASRTAAIINAELDLGPVAEEPDLRERKVGLFTGLTNTEIRARWPECFDPRTGRPISVPDGEDDDMLFGRAAPALVGLARRHRGEVLLVVSHGGVIRALERRLGLKPPVKTPNLAGRWLEVGHDAGDDPAAAL